MNGRIEFLLSGAIAAAFLCGGCSLAYSPPKVKKQEYEEKVNASKQKIYAIAMQVLRRSGLRFAFADQQEGRISTRPKTMTLSEKECDCGGARNLLFSSLKGTTTDVSYFLIVREGGFKIRCVIEGQYVASDTSIVKRFQCVSRGLLEKDLIEKIKSGIAESALPQPAVEEAQ